MKSASQRPLLFKMLRTALGAILALFLGNWIAAQCGLRWVAPATHDHLMVYKFFADEEHPVDVICFGSSHTRSALLPSYMEKELTENLGREVRVWNLAVPAGTAPLMPAVMDRCFQPPRLPKILVVEADPLFWNEALHGQNAVQYFRWFAPFGHVLRTLGQVPFEETAAGIAQWTWGWEAAWQLTAFAVSSEARQRWAHYRDTRGGRWKEHQIQAAQEGRWRRINRRMEQHLADQQELRRLVHPFVGGEDWEQHLKNIAGFCEENDIRLVLVNHPVMNEFMGLYQQDEYENHLSWLRGMAQKWDFTVIDLNQPEARERANFADLHHLQPAAAVEYSRKFATDHLLPHLAKP